MAGSEVLGCPALSAYRRQHRPAAHTPAGPRWLLLRAGSVRRLLAQGPEPALPGLGMAKRCAREMVVGTGR